MLLCFSVQFINSVLFLMDSCTSCAEQQQPMIHERSVLASPEEQYQTGCGKSLGQLWLLIVFFMIQFCWPLSLSLSFFLTVKADLCLHFYLCVIKYFSLWLTEHKTSTYCFSLPLSLSLSPHTHPHPPNAKCWNFWEKEKENIYSTCGHLLSSEYHYLCMEINFPPSGAGASAGGGPELHGRWHHRGRRWRRCWESAEEAETDGSLRQKHQALRRPLRISQWRGGHWGTVPDRNGWRGGSEVSLQGPVRVGMSWCWSVLESHPW